jgi:hypothetical protein
MPGGPGDTRIEEHARLDAQVSWGLAAPNRKADMPNITEERPVQVAPEPTDGEQLARQQAITQIERTRRFKMRAVASSLG